MSQQKEGGILAEIRKRIISTVVLLVVSIIVIALGGPLLRAIGVPVKFGINLGVVSVELEPENRERVDPSDAPNSQEALTPDFGEFFTPTGSSATNLGVCPYDAYGFNLYYPNYWYGPIDGYWVMYNSWGGFEVFDPYYYQQSYPDPSGAITRNQWTPLDGSPFDVCVDGYNYVYARFNY